MYDHIYLNILHHTSGPKGLAVTVLDRETGHWAEVVCTTSNGALVSGKELALSVRQAADVLKVRPLDLSLAMVAMLSRRLDKSERYNASAP